MGVDLRKLKRAVRKLGERELREKRGRPGRAIAGAVLSAGIFVAVAFGSWKLGFDVAIALACGAAAMLACSLALWPRPKVIAPLLAVAILIAGAGALWPREERYITFLYHGYFEYRGSADNAPIENLAIRLPCPNIENKAVENISSRELLWWRDYDNTPRPQIGYPYKGQRTRPLIIENWGIEETSRGPKLSLDLNVLYPREIFQIEALITVPARGAAKVTLRDYGDPDGRSTGAFFSFSPLAPLEKPINATIWALLMDEEDRVIEKFVRYIDGEGSDLGMVTYWLYPSPTT